MSAVGRLLYLVAGASLIAASYVAAAHDDLRRTVIWCAMGLALFSIGLYRKEPRP